MRPFPASAVVAVLTAATAVTLAAPATAAPSAPAVTQPGYFHTVGPKRVADTRTTNSPLGPGGALTVRLGSIVTSGTANAAVLNLTVTSPTTAGFLTVYPHGSARPLASSLNKRAGETRSNSVTVALPANGSRTVDVYNQLGSSQVIVDVTGYYDPDVNSATPTLTAYYPSSPTRVADTRTGDRLVNGSRFEIITPDRAPAVGVQAVAVTITAVGPSGPGYLTAWSGRNNEPPTSTVNYGADPVTPNYAIVPAFQDDDGMIHFLVENHAASTNVVVDLVGLYAQPAVSGGLYLPVTPTRTVDTRISGGPLGPGETRRLGVGDVNRSATVDAVNLNLSAVDATTPTYLTAYATDASRPTVSNLNVSTTDALCNAVQVGVTRVVGSTHANAFQLYNFAGSVDVVADVQGYFLDITSG